VVNEVDERVARWTKIPPVYAEDMQVGGRRRSRELRSLQQAPADMQPGVWTTAAPSACSGSFRPDMVADAHIHRGNKLCSGT
jgi:hypothetical protein